MPTVLGQIANVTATQSPRGYKSPIPVACSLYCRVPNSSFVPCDVYAVHAFTASNKPTISFTVVSVIFELDLATAVEAIASGYTARIVMLQTASYGS